MSKANGNRNTHSHTLNTHPRTLRRNIWAGLLCATDQEIRDGMDFYPGAHGLCRLFASMHKPLTPSQIAGIYAALSPMNGWYTNVANVLDVLRRGWHSTVNTSNINHWKALAIYHGADPEQVLGSGRKVKAFYRAIANPDDTNPIPVDRHLICLALGIKITSNEQLRSLSGNCDLYSCIESAYHDLGRREGLGNRLASIAWFVQRRITRDHQPLYYPGSPVCCNRPMWTQGAKRFQCGQCKSTRVRERSVRKRTRVLAPEILTDFAIPRDILSADARGRIIIYLGPQHKYARSGGVNYLSRYVVESHLGHRLRTDEHVHHANGKLHDCRLSNLEVWLAEPHGRYHAKTQLLYMFRDERGRFAPSNVPSFDKQIVDSHHTDDLAYRHASSLDLEAPF